MNKIRSVSHTINKDTINWTVGKASDLPCDGGKLGVVVESIEECFDKEMKEVYYLIVARNKKNEKALWKKVHKNTIIEYDIVSLLK